MNKTYNNIIFFSNGSIGDFLMTLSFLERVHDVAGDASCVVIVPRMGAFLSDLASSYPYISIYEISKQNPVHFFVLVFKFFQKNLVVTHHTYSRLPSLVKKTARFFALRKGSLFAGFKDMGSMKGYDVIVSFDSKVSYPENMNTLLRECGLGDTLETEQRLVYRKQESVLNELGLGENEYFVFHPFAASAGSLPIDRYSIILNALIKEFPQIVIVITGAGGDVEKVHHILEHVHNKERVRVAMDMGALELLTLVDGGSMYIGVDTGVTHIASFLHKKSVVIGHQASPSWLPTYNENACILYNNDRCTCLGNKNTDCLVEYEGQKYLRCMFDISNEDILEAVIDCYERT